MIFKPSELDRAILFLKGLFDKRKHVKIEYIPQTKSIEQNRYIWLVFTIIAEETGSDKNYMYHLFMKRFPVFMELKNEFGEMELCPITMSLWSKLQMSDFIDKVVTEARTNGFEIPDPEDKKALEMYDYYRQKGVL